MLVCFKAIKFRDSIVSISDFTIVFTCILFVNDT